ncbi:MAG: HAMP domain-containing sensor histidine kinase [Verrucomicrobiales bacterium]|nr:HAMP domain-containing sensor histidine kinase [Verrucomicrobiales bacterium]
MKKGLWLSQRHVRWMIVLLALLPLLPTAMLVQVMRQSALGDREAAATELSSMYRQQLIQLSERYSAMHKESDPEALVDYLRQVFGEEIELISFAPELAEESAFLGEEAAIHTIGEGGLAGWTVAIDSIPRFQPHVIEQKEEALWHAVFICMGVVVVGGIVWFAVHRQLRVDELRGDLLATVSHELKTPISASGLLIDTLASGNLDETETADYLALVSRENDRLAELADQFLTFSRLERGQVRNRPVSCRLANLIEEQVLLMEPRFSAAGGQLTWSCDPAIEVATDPQAAKVVLSNLFTNVLKYGGSPPRGEVSVSTDGGMARVQVRDDGPGVERRERRAIFRKYYRSDAELTETRSGMGLGLTICRQFAQLVKGGLKLIDGQARGSCFEFSLPLSEGGLE